VVICVAPFPRAPGFRIFCARVAHDVFISYASQDKPAADAVCARLESRGIRCWYAPRDVPPGQTWAESILEAITGARVLVLVYTAHSNASPQVLREVERAVHHRLALLPIRLEDAPFSGALEYFVSTPHWLEAMTPPLEKHLGAVADAVRKILDAAEGPRHPDPPGDAVPAPRPAPRRRFGPAHAAIALLLAGVAAWAVFGRGGGDGGSREVAKGDTPAPPREPPVDPPAMEAPPPRPPPEKPPMQVEAESARDSWKTRVRVGLPASGPYAARWKAIAEDAARAEDALEAGEFARAVETYRAAHVAEMAFVHDLDEARKGAAQALERSESREKLADADPTAISAHARSLATARAMVAKDLYADAVKVVANADLRLEADVAAAAWRTAEKDAVARKAVLDGARAKAKEADAAYAEPRYEAAALLYAEAAEAARAAPAAPPPPPPPSLPPAPPAMGEAPPAMAEPAPAMAEEPPKPPPKPQGPVELRVAVGGDLPQGWENRGVVVVDAGGVPGVRVSDGARSGGFGSPALAFTTDVTVELELRATANRSRAMTTVTVTPPDGASLSITVQFSSRGREGDRWYAYVGRNPANGAPYATAARGATVRVAIVRKGATWRATVDGHEVVTTAATGGTGAARVDVHFQDPATALTALRVRSP
jgi:hypothetical protein